MTFTENIWNVCNPHLLRFPAFPRNELDQQPFQLSLSCCKGSGALLEASGLPAPDSPGADGLMSDCPAKSSTDCPQTRAFVLYVPQSECAAQTEPSSALDRSCGPEHPGGITIRCSATSRRAGKHVISCDALRKFQFENETTNTRVLGSGG